VKHVVRRGEYSVYVVNAPCTWLAARPSLRLRAAPDAHRTANRRIEKMTSMTRLQALPLPFAMKNATVSRPYRAGQTVVPVVKPDGFLTPKNFFCWTLRCRKKQTPSVPRSASRRRARYEHHAMTLLNETICNLRSAPAGDRRFAVTLRRLQNWSRPAASFVFRTTRRGRRRNLRGPHRAGL